MLDDNESSKPDQPKGFLNWFAKHPWVGVLGTIASIISIPLAWFIYIAGQKEREIVYATSAAPITIVKSMTRSVNWGRWAARLRSSRSAFSGAMAPSVRPMKLAKFAVAVRL